MQIRALLRAAGEQNTAVSQSRNRIHNRSMMADTVQSAHSPRSPRGVRDMGISRNNTETTSSMITDSVVMTVVEYPRLLRGVDHMCLDNMMRDALVVAIKEYQPTQGSQALMRDLFSFKV